MAAQKCTSFVCNNRFTKKNDKMSVNTIWSLKVVHISRCSCASYGCLYIIYADNQITTTKNQNLHIKTEATERCRINIQTVITETNGKVNRINT